MANKNVSISSIVRDVSKIAIDYDLVVTTYQTLATDFSSSGKEEDFEPIGKIHWVR